MVPKGDSPPMQRIRPGSLFLSLLLCGVALHLGRPVAAPAQEQVTVQGEIVDLTCYMTKGSRGADHKGCAQQCAKKGLPIGVLTDGGDLYLLLDDHNDPEPYEAAKKIAGDRGEIAGKKVNKQGVDSIIVSSAKAL